MAVPTLEAAACEPAYRLTVEYPFIQLAGQGESRMGVAFNKLVPEFQLPCTGRIEPATSRLETAVSDPFTPRQRPIKVASSACMELLV